MGDRFTCAVVTFNDGTKCHYTEVRRGGLSMSSRGARIALTMLDGSIRYLEESNSVMMVDDYWLSEHHDLISPDPESVRGPTPGPWWVEATGAVVAGDLGHYRVIADTHVSNVPESQCSANAELMAQAQQMKVLLNAFVECSHHNKSMRTCVPSELLRQSEQVIETLR